MRTFCTIITPDYLPYAITLHRSLVKINPEEKLKVLVCGDMPATAAGLSAGIELIDLNKLYGYRNADSLFHKYADKSDALRWSMKPVFTAFLLEHGFEKVIYTDCDLFFFNNYEFLFEDLEKYSILLSPHRYTSNPLINEEEFLSSFRFGQFNAGFIAASKKGIPALDWWARSCDYQIEQDFAKGLNNDQRYLDNLPVLFEDVKIIQHRGCNVAFWNQHECERVMVNGELLISKTYPVIFVHFHRKYFAELMEGHDQLIFPYFKEFEKTFNESGHNLIEFIKDMPDHKEASTVYKLKRKLLLRTRFKRWLFRLSQK